MAARGPPPTLRGSVLMAAILQLSAVTLTAQAPSGGVQTQELREILFYQVLSMTSGVLGPPVSDPCRDTAANLTTLASALAGSDILNATSENIANATSSALGGSDILNATSENIANATSSTLGGSDILNATSENIANATSSALGGSDILNATSENIASATSQWATEEPTLTGPDLRPDGECLTSCPPFSVCVLWRGTWTCRCDGGYHFDQLLGCVPARTFPGRLVLQHLRDKDGRVYSHTMMTSHVAAPQDLSGTDKPLENQDIILHVEGLFQKFLSTTNGYLTSSVVDHSPNHDTLTILHYFSTLSKFREDNVSDTIERQLLECGETNQGCGTLADRLTYHNFSLCKLEICDSLSTSCFFSEGLAECRCRPGYGKFYPADRACRACDSGFQYLGGACERCPFGFGGFECEEPLLLALLLVSIAAGAFLLVSLILGGLLCSRRRKSPAPRPLYESHVLGMPRYSEALRLPRVRSIWSRGLEGTGEDSRYITHLGRPSSGNSTVQSISDVWMRPTMESQRSQDPASQHGHQNMGFDSEEVDWTKSL